MMTPFAFSTNIPTLPDFVMGFQYEADARGRLVQLKERLAKFKLVLHEQKTRLIEFGKLVSELRRKRGAARCETFKSLGFMHYCAWSWDGRFVVKRRTDPKRLTRKLKELRIEARRRMHTRLCCSIDGCQRFARTLCVFCSAEQFRPD